MQSKNLLYAGLLALALSIISLIGWEWFWRSRGYTATYNDDKALWAFKRKEVYQPMDNATVFIGSSRIKFDLDIPAWKALTGENAVQLSLVGTSPLLLLDDLGEDENFKGKLVVDVTEVLFFSPNPAFHQSAREAVAFYKKQTPAEKFSSRINFALESQLVFLEERRFSLNTLLNDLGLPDRPGVFSFPSFPKGFEWTTFERQTYMSDIFLSDTNDINKQTSIWSRLIMGDKTPPASGDALSVVMKKIKTAVAKIRGRGGKVIFVRTPSSGTMEEGEKRAYPRHQYWDQLLTITHTDGIHYEDDPETAGLVCPEWSHLSPKDAIAYTHHLVKELSQKNWFAGKTDNR